MSDPYPYQNAADNAAQAALLGLWSLAQSQAASIATLQTDLAALAARVTALETPAPPAGP
jgi:hypothetical protein